MPCPNLQNGTIEPYDSLLGISDDYDTHRREMTICLDNEKLYYLAQKKAEIENPSFLDINKIVANLISKLTIRERFNYGLNGGLTDLYSNLIPYRSMKYITPSLTTLVEDDTLPSCEMTET